MSVRRTRHRDSFHDLENVEPFAEYEERPSRLKGDERNVAILFFLYLLQGIPLGLMQAIPIILANSGVNYKQQAQFSLVNWPFSLKLLWAPIVDSVYWSRMGKRKSWLVPIQYLIGCLMLFLSTNVDDMLEGEEPSIFYLVSVFFLLNFLAATQDIAVDGWALTMLRRYVESWELFSYFDFFLCLGKMWLMHRRVIALGRLLGICLDTSRLLLWNRRRFVTRTLGMSLLTRESLRYLVSLG